MTMRKCSIALAVSLVGLWAFPKTTTTLIFTGDILLDRGVRQVIAHSTPDRLFSPSVDSLLASADVAVGNLECPATVVVSPAFKRFVFRAEPEWLGTLQRHGFTHLNLANNHSIDQGRRGLTDTRLNVLSAGMTPVGAGQDMSEASQPVLLTAEPRHVWLLASCRLPLENFAYLPGRPCVSQEPLDTLLARIATLRTADPRAVIVVTLHWGGEHTLKPLPQQRVEARRIIDAGADAIVGHHTHTLQPTENYRGRPIYYGIGNFIFDQRRPQNSKACVVRLTVGTDSLEASAIPITIRHCVPSVDDNQGGFYYSKPHNSFR